MSGASLFVYVIAAIPLWKLSKKLHEEPAWFAWVPILNLVLFMKIARKPLWWIILMLIPFVNIYFAIVVFMALCERMRVNKWWGLLAVVAPANLILLYILAFMDHGGSHEVPATAMPDAPKS